MTNMFNLFDYVNDGMFVIDREYNIVFWNKRLELLSDIPKDEIVGDDLFKRFPHLNKRFYKYRIDEILAGGSPAIFSSQIHKYIIPCKLPNGKLRTQNTSVVAITADDGQIYASFSLQDISDEIMQMEKYKEMRDKALNEVENRKHVEAQLRELNHNKDRFFSIIGHDLKNPLNALHGYSEMLLEDYTEMEDHERLEIIESFRRISKGIIGLLENLLDWARVQTGRIQYNPEKFRLCSLADKLSSIAELPAKNKEIKLNFICSEDIEVFADKNMIETVLRNLISNSIKFTHRGGEISIKAVRDEKFIEIRVTDTGIGINEEILGKIFTLEKNYTTPGTEDEKGTGLGLLLCKELVEKNKGTIAVESKPGQGTTFIVKLRKNIV